MGKKNVFVPTKDFVKRECINCGITFYAHKYIVNNKTEKRGRVCSYECNIKTMRKYAGANGYSHVIKHGMSMTPTYHAWQAMKTRCYNKNFHAYPNYGARGITVCDRWLESFENFYKDMGEKPHKKSLDRIDNSKGYSKENCRWATSQQQVDNRRNTIRIKSGGVNETIRYWSGKTGLPAHIILYRYHRGLPVKDILSIKKL